MNDWLVASERLPMLPAMLLTASDLDSRGAVCAPVGTVSDRATGSSTLDADHSACNGVGKSFYWVAIGWPQECCAVERT
jgi:hypothetical protein